MLSVVSPAKTLDFDSKSPVTKATQPVLLDAAEGLIDILRDYSPKQVSKLMGVSANLGELNATRFSEWSRPFNKKNAKQSLTTFKGDVYVGMDIDSFKPADFTFAQDHLRILSGLYGILRPLDLMQAYRLEMGTKLKTPAGRNLYDYWGDEITREVNKQLKKTKSKTLLNLASVEYFKSLQEEDLDAEVVTPVFKDLKNDKYKIISFFAKKARGMMAGFAIRNKITDVAKLKKFKTAGYKYSAAESSDRSLVFLRDEPQ